MDRRKVYKVPRVVENKVKEINDLIRWVQDKDNIVGGYFGSTYYTYLDFKKPITIRNQFVYIEYHDGGKLVKERYNFNKETGYNSLEELKWELSRILRAYRKAKKDYDTKGYFQKGGSLKGSKKKPRVAKEQKGRSFEEAWGRFKKDVRDNTTPRKMAKGGKLLPKIDIGNIIPTNKGNFEIIGFEEDSAILNKYDGGFSYFKIKDENGTIKYMKISREENPKMFINNRPLYSSSWNNAEQVFARGGEVKVGDKVKSKSYDYYSLNKGVVKTLVNGKSLIEGIEEDEGREVYGNIKNFQKYAKGGKIDEKIKILKKEGYPHKQAVAIALSMRDSGKLARGGRTKDAKTLREMSKALKKGSGMHEKQSQQLIGASSSHKKQAKNLDRIADKISKGYARGGEVEFTDIDSKKYIYNTSRKGWDGYKSVEGENSVGSFAHRYKDKYIGDYYLFLLDDYDKKFFSHLKLKPNEMLFRSETDTSKISRSRPLIKINIENGRVYFLSDDNDYNSDVDDKTPKFDRASADVIYVSLDNLINRYNQGLITYSEMLDFVNQRDKGYAKGGEVENEMTDVDWDEIFGGLDKEPTQEEIELENIEQEENEKQIRNNFAKHLGYNVSWDKVVLDLVKDTKFMISQTSMYEKNDYSYYIRENINDLKRLRFGAEKYANRLLDLYDKKLNFFRNKRK